MGGGYLITLIVAVMVLWELSVLYTKMSKTCATGFQKYFLCPILYVLKNKLSQ